MNSSRVTLLGTGTCRIDPAAGQVSAALVRGSSTFVVDIGAGSLERLIRSGALERCTDLHLHITHRHIDHAIGIFPLLQCLTWSDDVSHLAVERVTIHATEEVCDLLQTVIVVWGASEVALTSQGGPYAHRRLEFRPGPNGRDWDYEVAGLTINSVHLPGHNNHGVTFELNGVRYGFTGDATEVTPRLQEFCRGAQVCVFDFGHLSNRILSEGRYESTLDRVVELLAGCGSSCMVASHIYLRHWQGRRITAEQRHSESVRLVREAHTRAAAAGFLGTVVVAKEFMELGGLAGTPPR